MAKVMISIPDDLLERVDSLAKARGDTRSGFLQQLAERAVDESEAESRAEAHRLLALIKADFRPGEPSVDAAQLIREDRESH